MDMDQHMQKSLLLGAVVTCLGFLNFFAAALLLGSILTDAPTTPLLILAAIVTLMWVALMAIALTLIQSSIVRYSIIVAAGLAVAAAGFARLGAIGGAILLVLVLTVAQRTFTRESTNRLLFRTRDVFTLGTRLVIIGVILAAAGLALPVIETSLAKEGLKISRDQTAIALRPIEPLLEQLVSGVSATDDIESLSTTQAPSITVSQLGLVDIVTDSINTTLTRLSQQYPLLIAGMLIILAFLTLRAFVPLIAWLVIVVIMTLLWTARRLHVLRIVSIQTTAQRLEF